ncbi:MAG TPA: methyltransferase domain-containing protein [Ktedonobacterales bacterium]
MGGKILVRPVVMREGGRKVLRVGGVIQSVHVDEMYVPDVWDALLPRRRPEHALILGLGGGTVATLLTRRWGAVPTIGVELDPAVIWLATHEFGLGELAHVRIVREDAFSYVRRCEDAFDAICVDLYTAGKMAHGVFDTTFLRHIARLLAPEGTVAFNLWRSAYLSDQLRRLRRVLTVVETVEADDNIVVHCRRG